MGTDVWKVSFTQIYDHLSAEELDFLYKVMAEADEAYYNVDEDLVEELRKSKEYAQFKDLIDALAKAVEDEGAITISLG
jgi:hypothetical protein